MRMQLVRRSQSQWLTKRRSTGERLSTGRRPGSINEPRPHMCINRPQLKPLAHGFDGANLGSTHASYSPNSQLEAKPSRRRHRPSSRATITNWPAFWKGSGIPCIVAATHLFHDDAGGLAIRERTQRCWGLIGGPHTRRGRKGLGTVLVRKEYEFLAQLDWIPESSDDRRL
jgi:hypothetical protein